jgi:hypothetical protein
MQSIQNLETILRRSHESGLKMFVSKIISSSIEFIIICIQNLKKFNITKVG